MNYRTAISSLKDHPSTFQDTSDLRQGVSREAALVTNTKLPSPYGSRDALEATAHAEFAGYEPRKKTYLLHNLVKQILTTAGETLYIRVSEEATHIKDKRKANTFHLVKPGEEGTHFYVVDGSGFDQYVPITKVRNGSYLYDSRSCRHRRAMPGETPTHHRVSTKFYRCGACNQLSTAFRPERNHSAHVTKEEMAYISENASVTKLQVQQQDVVYQGKVIGLSKCDSVHYCPTCQPIMAKLKAQEVNIALYQNYKKGGYAVMLTFTCRHKKDYSLEKTLQGLQHAMSRLRSGKAWKSFKERHGVNGYIDSLEYTYTEGNGHHPHKHCIMLFDDKPDLLAIKNELFARYKAIYKKMPDFYVPSSKRGIDIKMSLKQDEYKAFFERLEVKDNHEYGDKLPKDLWDELNKLSAYIVKGLDTNKDVYDSVSSNDWNLGVEITHNHCKTSIYSVEDSSGNKTKGYTATGLLLKYYSAVKCLRAKGLTKEDRTHFLKQKERFRLLFIEYASKFKGRSQVFFSKGLKDSLNVKEILTSVIERGQDKIQEKEIESPPVDVMNLENQDLAVIAKHRLLHEIRTIAGNAFTFCNDSEKVKKSIRELLDDYSEEEREDLNIGLKDHSLSPSFVSFSPLSVAQNE